VSEQHLYEHTERFACLEVTHSPAADIVAFHIPPAATMRPLKAPVPLSPVMEFVVSYPLHDGVLFQELPYAAFVGGEGPGEFRKRRGGICLPATNAAPRIS